MTARQYRKRPVVIEAMCFDGDNALDIVRWMGARHVSTGRDGRQLIIPTLEGDFRASLGDYIVRGVEGEFYPCKPSIFRATYEPVADAPDPGGEACQPPYCDHQQPSDAVTTSASERLPETTHPNDRSPEVTP